MNKFIQAITSLDVTALEEMIRVQSKWLEWSEKTGKNGLHYLCGLNLSGDTEKATISLHILKLLLNAGMDMNAVHKIEEGCDFFPATPLWYAYAKGRNETLFTYLLKNGADPEHCMFAIAWNDDVASATLFKKYGASINSDAFLGAFNWKRFNVAEWFLKNGADVNVTDAKGNTALLLAVKRKYDAALINMLLQYGADMNKENNERVSPKKLAEISRQQKILRLFAAAQNDAGK